MRLFNTFDAIHLRPNTDIDLLTQRNSEKISYHKLIIQKLILAHKNHIRKIALAPYF